MRVALIFFIFLIFFSLYSIHGFSTFYLDMIGNETFDVE